MNEIPKLVASTTLTGPLPWNATVINGDVAAVIAGLSSSLAGTSRCTAVPRWCRP